MYLTHRNGVYDRPLSITRLSKRKNGQVMSRPALTLLPEQEKGHTFCFENERHISACLMQQVQGDSVNINNDSVNINKGVAYKKRIASPEQTYIGTSNSSDIDPNSFCTYASCRAQ